MQYSYDNFIGDLSHGHEFDLIYKNIKYGISWTNGSKICLAQYGNENYSFYFNIDDFILNAKIGGQDFKKIWTDLEIEVIY